MPLETKSQEEIDKARAQIQSWFDHKPTKEQCEGYSKAHTEMQADRHFYLFKFNVNRGRLGDKLTTHVLSSDSVYSSSSIMNIINKSLEKGIFVSLEKVTIKEYAQNGGADIPCCLRNCEYEGDWPPCIKK